MGLPRPSTTDNDGDESVFTPKRSDTSLIATLRGSDASRRLETDASRNLYVNVAAGTITVTPSGTQNVNIVSSIPLAVTVDGIDALLLDATFTARINTQGQKAMAASTPVVIASDQSTISTQNKIGVTSTLTNVAGSASSVQLLAANTARVRAVIYNDSLALLYVKEGTTASATSFTWLLQPGDHVIIDDYNGRIDGIWASATGNARVTETV